MINQKHTFSRIQGFTIVELIVVIAVIGILATITVVGYGNWRTNATAAQLKSDLNGAVSAMENARNFGNGYPPTVPTSFTPSSGVTLAGGGRADGKTYCVTATSSSVTYVISDSNTTPTVGVCPLYVTTLAGSGVYGFVDGPGISAQFRQPAGVAVDSSGNVYAGDQNNNRIRKITPAGVVSTLAGTGVAGFADGPGASAQFQDPSGVAVDSAGNVYVADFWNSRIRKITPAGVVSTLAGTGVAGFADGPGASAKFNYTSGVAVDSSGTVYVSDYGDFIRKITPAGVVSTLAGTGVAGFADGPGASAKFDNPQGIAVDSTGTVYVADAYNNRIRKITPAGVVSTLAGTGVYGFADGPGASAQFDNPQGAAVDSTGAVYVAEQGNNRIRKITPAGVVSTLAGSGVAGFADGSAITAQFRLPTGLAVDSAGTVYVGDYVNYRIRKIQ